MKEIALAMPNESLDAFRTAIGIIIRAAHYATEPIRQDRKYLQEIINKNGPETFLHYKQILPWYLTIGLQQNRLII